MDLLSAVMTFVLQQGIKENYVISPDEKKNEIVLELTKSKTKLRFYEKDGEILIEILEGEIGVVECHPDGEKEV